MEGDSLGFDDSDYKAQDEEEEVESDNSFHSAQYVYYSGESQMIESSQPSAEESISEFVSDVSFRKIM